MGHQRQGINTWFTWLLMFALFPWSPQALAADSQKNLIISAAASLTNVMQDMARDFERQHPNVTITCNVGATGDLLAQMSQGAPVDIFASASVKHMDQAQEKDLIFSESRKTFAGNTLVLARPAKGTIPLNELLDLTAPSVARIGIGKPESVPAGSYGKEALVAAGLWTAVESKLIFGSSVRQVLDYLRRGEVDAALIYASDAKTATGQVEIVTELTGTRILYPVALATTTRDRETAAVFLAYLTTDAARALLSSHGFLVP